ncbi:MAG: hypothetical protein FJ388_25305, partial [Verrucomicrobia bacterium]|nr:hypothetical protein [Verrucomicrobiota bacterium]
MSANAPHLGARASRPPDVATMSTRTAAVSSDSSSSVSASSTVAETKATEQPRPPTVILLHVKQNYGTTPRAGGDARAPRRLLRFCAIVLLLPLLACLVFCSAVRWWPYPAGLDKSPASGTWIEDRNGRPLAAFVAPNDQWHLPLKAEQFSPHLLNAIVAVEDHRFFQHHGVDWRAIVAACWQNLTALRVRRGGSTITMQVQRLRDPRPRTLSNKVVEAIRARQLEQRYDKEALLAEYINRAPFGGNLVGAGAASWRYFGRACRDLSLGQAALLAGLPQNPHRFRPDQFPQRAMARRNHVLDRMLACGMITPRQRDEARNEPLDAAWRPLPQARAEG